MNKLIRGIAGAEGPCTSLDGRIFMVEPSAGRILEVLPEGGSRDIANTGGVPAGLQFDRNNDLWLADMKLGVLRVSLDGGIYPEVTEFEGAPMRGSNDCYFDSQGNLYFTAPEGSGAENPTGEVFCRLTDGTARRLDGGYAFSNGLAVTADDKLLIVAETMTRQLHAYDIVEPGVVSNKRVWATLSEDGLGPDGMDFDSDGNLLVAHFGSGRVEIYDPAGNYLSGIEVPGANLTNVHFMAPGSRELLVTDSSDGALWLTSHSLPGQQQYSWDEA